MKKFILFLSFFTLPFYGASIVMQIDPYPNQSVSLKLNKAGNSSKTILRNSLQAPTAGIFATYGGFLNASTYGGLLTFPLKHNQPRVNLIITTHISQIVMFEQTIEHLEILPGVPVDWYTLERITDDETGLTFWDTQKTTPPADNRIPLESIVIIAKPENVYVPTGITLTDPGVNFLLPTIYAKPSMQITKNSLYLLNFSHLFGQVNIEKELKPLSYQIQPTN